MSTDQPSDSPPCLGQVLVGDQFYDVMQYRFHNGRVAVMLEKGGICYYTVATNVSAAEIADDEFFAKMYNENAALREPLLECGLFTDTGRRHRLNFVELEVWRLVTPVA